MPDLGAPLNGQDIYLAIVEDIPDCGVSPLPDVPVLKHTQFRCSEQCGYTEYAIDSTAIHYEE